MRNFFNFEKWTWHKKILLRLEKLAQNWHDVLSINCWYSSTFRQHFVKVILHLILHLHFTPPFYTSFLHLYFYPIFTSSLYLFKLIFGPFSKPLYVHLKFMHYCFIYCLTLSSKNYVSLLITANCITVKFDALIAELNKNVTVKFKPLEIMYHEINAWNKKLTFLSLAHCWPWSWSSLMGTTLWRLGPFYSIGMHAKCTKHGKWPGMRSEAKQSI